MKKLNDGNDPRIKSIIGKRFNHLRAVKFVKLIRRPCGRHFQIFEFRCDCGKLHQAEIYNVKKGRVKSCGCHRSKISKLIHTIHGFSHHPIYGVWEGIKTRCSNSQIKKFRNYGGRGIQICDQWLKFENFFTDMFPTWKRGLQIERINNNGNYEPSNCRWATRLEQGKNKRNNFMIECNSRRLHLSEWARITGLVRTTISKRIKRGMSPAEALSI